MNLYVIAKNRLRSTLHGMRMSPHEKRDDRYPHLFILGMHRSGTSCLTGILESHGLYIGEVSRKDRFNKKGLLENVPSRKVNQKLLKLVGSSWRNPSRVLEATDELRRQIETVCRDMDQNRKFWGIKDPRILFCLDLWRKPSTRLVGTFRHPHSVARSLMTRHNREGKATFTFEGALKLWYLYNSELVRIYREEAFPIVSFDWEPSRYRAAVLNIALRLSLNNGEDNFFDASLRKNNCTEDVDNAECETLYKELIEIAKTEEERLRQT